MSDSKDLWPLKHSIKAMRRHDLVRFPNCIVYRLEVGDPDSGIDKSPDLVRKIENRKRNLSLDLQQLYKY